VLKLDFTFPRGNIRVMRFSIKIVARIKTCISQIRDTKNQFSLPSTKIKRLSILGSIKILNRSLITSVYSAMLILIPLNSLMGFTRVPIPKR